MLKGDGLAISKNQPDDSALYSVLDGADLDWVFPMRMGCSDGLGSDGSDSTALGNCSRN